MEPKNRKEFSRLVEMLATELSNDPNTPESIRVSSNMIIADHKLQERLHFAIKQFMEPLGHGCSDEVIKQGKEFVAYLECVIAGLDNFLAQYNNK